MKSKLKALFPPTPKPPGAIGRILGVLNNTPVKASQRKPAVSTNKGKGKR
jgi:hypothetical protein